MVYVLIYQESRVTEPCQKHSLATERALLQKRIALQLKLSSAKILREWELLVLHINPQIMEGIDLADTAKDIQFENR